MNKLKEAQQSFIIDEATKLFFSRSISEVTIQDIAKDLGIGEATLYRYFKKKSNLVLLCLERLSNKVSGDFFKMDESKNGYERVKDFYYSYLNIFTTNKNYYSFIYHFDSYILREKETDLSQYNASIDSFKRIYIESFNLGLKDGSIKFNDDVELFYRSTTLSLLNLCKKLAVEDNLTNDDKKYDASKEIENLIEIFLYRIK